MSLPDAVAVISRFFVLVVFLLSATGKLTAFGAFTGSVTALTGVAAKWVKPIAAAVITAEALVSALLCLGGDWSMAGAALAVAVLAVFTGVLGVALARGSGAACSCFGATQHEVASVDLVRNGLLIAAGAYCLLHPVSAGRDPVQLVLLAGVALMAVVLCLHLRETVELIAPARLG